MLTFSLNLAAALRWTRTREAFKEVSERIEEQERPGGMRELRRWQWQQKRKERREEREQMAEQEKN